MRDPVYRSGHGLVKWMTVLLIVDAALSLMALWSTWGQIDRIDRAETEFERVMAGLEEELARLEEEPGGAETQRSWVDAYIVPGGLIGLVQAGVQLALIILFCIWIPRANRNARALGATGMRFTPGWSVGWYFIPIMNLFRPYQAMKEIWVASVPSDATPRQRRAGSPLLGWWWALWLVSGAAALRTFPRWVPTKDWVEMRRAIWATCASDAIDIPLAIVALLLVRSVHGMQERRRTTTVFD